MTQGLATIHPLRTTTTDGRQTDRRRTTTVPQARQLLKYGRL